MKIITKHQFLDQKDFFIAEIQSGKVFIYPTDTVLGIGCVVTARESVDRIFELKKREQKPLLIIIPNLGWLDENTLLSEENKNFISTKLPGPYSFVVTLRDPESIYPRVHGSLGTIGIRIPDNWFSECVSKVGTPFITTSVNIAGEPSCLHISDIPEEILQGVDYVVESDDAFLGKSSTLIDMREEERIVLRK